MGADGRGIVSLVFCTSSVKNGLNFMWGWEGGRFRELKRSKYQQPAAVGTVSGGGGVIHPRPYNFSRLFKLYSRHCLTSHTMNPILQSRSLFYGY